MLKRLSLVFFLIINAIAFGLEIDKNIIRDDLGNEIAIKKYNRIVILDPAVVETFYMIGAEDKITAIGKGSKTKIYPLEKTKKLKNIGHMVNLNFENVLECNPDLVILNPMGSKTQEKLKSFKIPFIVNRAHNFDDILKNIEIYGKLTGKEENANNLIMKNKNQLRKLKEKINKNPLKLKGAIIYGTSPIMAFRENSLPGQILEFLGIKNIASGLVGAKPILSQEYILKENPDFIAGTMLLKKPDDLVENNEMLKNIDAYKNKNIFLVDSTKTMRGSPRIFEALDEFYNELCNLKK